ncbi:MAG: sugar ABC transporter permease [Actinomycetota bacterium]
MRTRPGTRAPWPYLVPTAVVLAVLAILPLVRLAQMSVSEVGPSTLIGPWETIGLDNIREILDDALFWKSLRATALFTGVLLVVDLGIGYVAASVLSVETAWTRTALRIMVFVWALPPLVSGSVWKFLLAGDGAINALLGIVGIDAVDWLSSPQLALWSVSLVAAWASLPFAILIIHGGMLGLPQDVMEAARIDGAGYVRMSRHVIVPMLRPTLTVLTVLVILYAFRSFDFVYVMTLGGPGTATTTLPYLAYDTAFKTYQFGIASGIALISMLLVVILSIPYVLGVRKEEGGA